MEQQHPEGLVAKAVAYVKEMFGPSPFPRDGESIVPADESALQPPFVPQSSSASEEDIPLYAPRDTLKSTAELNAESARREDGE